LSDRIGASAGAAHGAPRRPSRLAHRRAIADIETPVVTNPDACAPLRRGAVVIALAPGTPGISMIRP
jgi:hypothetical protein